MSNSKAQSYNVRIIKGTDGKFRLGSFMDRAARRGRNDIRWVDASDTDKRNLLKQLEA